LHFGITNPPLTIQQPRDSAIQQFRNPATQQSSNPAILRFRDSAIQQISNPAIQRFSDSANPPTHPFPQKHTNNKKQIPYPQPFDR